MDLLTVLWNMDKDSLIYEKKVSFTQTPEEVSCFAILLQYWKDN